ncbi:hypothetical protein QWY90_05775 [Flavobacterium paronense]|uniref:Tetratricopeptide repeat protein n=1 Tax=Flavobacterium paronense TaxID=1392775 RepID=A0ABV5GB22_9FLAO|nr:hypothetical protein [Flavobacterium paronense]MDN3676819.1 hypothetical protein [Flavobacterium paronense]
MKNYTHFFLALGSVFSYSCFAQSNVKTLSDLSSKNDLAVVSYHVEERINMNFGGSVRTYEVTNLDLITPKDIGKNNVRIITPKYAKVKEKVVAVETISNKKTTVTNNLTITSKPINTDLINKVEQKNTTTSEKKKDYVNIDVVGTYERIMDKGFKSVSMITKVADRNFFEGNMDKAAKLYAELFEITSDLEAVYYYRYGQSLVSIGETEKGNELIKIFKAKSL